MSTLVHTKELCQTFKPDIIHSHLYLSEIVVHENVRTLELNMFHIAIDNIVRVQKLNIFTFLNKKELLIIMNVMRLFSKYNDEKTFIAISKDTEKYFKSNLSTKFKVQCITYS